MNATAGRVPEGCLDCASLIFSIFSHRMKPKKTINRIGRASTQHKITSSTQKVSIAIAFTLSSKPLPDSSIILYSAVTTPVLTRFLGRRFDRHLYAQNLGPSTKVLF